MRPVKDLEGGTPLVAPPIMTTEDEELERDRKVYSTFIRMAFTPYAIHFKSPRYMKESTLERIDMTVLKKTLHLTRDKAYVRLAIGTSRPFWEELTQLFRTAVISVERRSFQQWDPSAVDYETTSSTLIASAYPGLWKDLDRINALVAIARNVLTVGEKVQDLCKECGFDEYMYKLINCCVRVTARGYDGDPSNGDEEKWGLTINAYKRVLITSLQFLNNFSARNERMKLLLWITLFDQPGALWMNTDEWLDEMFEASFPLGEFTAPESLPNPKLQATKETTNTFLIGPNSEKRVDWRSGPMPVASVNAGGTALVMASREFSLEGYTAFIEAEKEKMRHEPGRELTPDQLGRELGRRWMELSEAQRLEWKVEYGKSHADKKQRPKAKQGQNRKKRRPRNPNQAGDDDDDYECEKSFELLGPTPLPESIRVEAATEDNYKLQTSAEAARTILVEGKHDLIRRISAYAFPEKTSPDIPETPEDLSKVIEETAEGPPTEELSDSDSEEEESDEDDEYHGSTEDGRGLLTDVPLILGPSEIEILPNMIMSGLIPQPTPNITSEQLSRMLDMYGTRCHLLLAHENGRNLLRELLIFVAAWDLREEELYFKFMVRIMEALLLNELLPFAYHSFREYEEQDLDPYGMLILSSHSKSRSKDIISPAQAVMMKLLTSVFRSHAENSKNHMLATGVLQEPSPVEVHLVKFLFTEFREHIVPSTCALIFLQGKIHEDMAPPEDFPLNLWDMERMYEGVYQYLEFFAVLTEEAFWKDIMAKWEVASELVTMLKELEDSIPKLSDDGKRELPESFWKAAEALYPDKAQAWKAQQALKVEQAKNGHSQNVFKGTQIKPPEIPPLSIPGVGGNSHAATPAGDAEAQAPFDEDSQEEPSDFEWRNLKKLTVLVLSSLIWKNKTVQDQVRNFGGLEALVGCCRHDEHNPYIREHAIMCLRFAVEGNPENAARIRQMAETYHQQLANVKSGTIPPSNLTAVEVPREVLDTQGYETFMDGKGQVGLRRKEIHHITASAQMTGSSSAVLQAAAAQAIQGAIAGTGLKGATPKMTKMAVERAAELMQNALRELPLPESFGKDDKGIIERLNKVALEHADLIASSTLAGPSKGKAGKKK
ncbi:hypothetical protein K461DRAFT_296815 [Myriangium duriaei CBS 260.36]|uniref:Ataxin-10 homolog n=1 Tax=Myriangium duriaei CBS 260.36 TaxID=1168546 RepID=A0A9P4MGV3_9PEZI|nr:hypothetical protein K461DRAFT_296815 [Myriangium duriaei CBS 260.36]